MTEKSGVTNFDELLKRLNINPLTTPEAVQRLELFGSDPKASVIRLERGSHMPAYKLVKKGGNLVVDLTHVHNVPVNDTFYKVDQSVYNVDLGRGTGVVNSGGRTFTVIGNQENGSKDTGKLYAWLDSAFGIDQDKINSLYE